MKNLSRLAVSTAAVLVVGCTVEKKADPAAVDSTVSLQSPPMMTLPPGARAATPPSSAPTSAPTLKDSMPLPKAKNLDSTKAGGERDSAIQPAFSVGADGKVHPIKK